MAQKKTVLLALLALGIFAGVLPVKAQQGFSGFSADMIQYIAQEKKETRGKIFIGKDKMRMDMDMGGTQGSIITRMDKKVAWTLMPEQMMYMEMPLTNQPEYSKALMDDPKGNSKLIGTEMIDGQLADKYASTGQGSTVYTWISQKLNVPLKVAAADGSFSMEYKNIKVGEPPANIFEIPSGYTKFSMDASAFMNR